MAGIQLTGLVNGLDTQSIIAQLMSVERAPRTKISWEQSATTKRQNLLTDLNTKAGTLKSASDALASAATWLDTQTVTSADTSKVDVTRTAGSPPGGYDISISQLASAERHTYDYQPPAADGPLEIHNQDGTLRASVSLK